MVLFFPTQVVICSGRIQSVADMFHQFVITRKAQKENQTLDMHGPQKMAIIVRAQLDEDPSSTEGPAGDVAVGLGRRRRQIGRPVRPDYDVLPPRP
jgi:hypothetical protein